ncbi:tRNA uridine(34) 5-carboxymethylaminomethyl modification radical SAM/GNAT enzyme Elp3 [Candidatus Woesearchaeota archaeon]|nr:tRNA uridine(34) 5-carboxymethylaminomethyl modification radical SAM/GNAT enzyme Elp3 [Candidatus Woesearchaeota archaeon]
MAAKIAGEVSAQQGLGKVSAGQVSFYKELIGFIMEKKPDKGSISKKKMALCKKHGLEKIPTDIEVLLNADAKDIRKIKRYLLTKPGRTLSGVAVIAIMSYPYPCPHGECIMCPSNTGKGVPQSYTGKEPAARRGIRNEFDPYLQVMNRLEQYIASGHHPAKAELIIMGGTFPSFDQGYQEDFVKFAFKAMNDFSSIFYDRDGSIDIVAFRKFFELPGDIGLEDRTQRIQKKLLEMKLKPRKKGAIRLESEQAANEKSVVRCVGLTIETRPDYCRLMHCNEMLRLGCTRVELGVQTVYDHVLEDIGRRHSVQDSIDATRTLKDLGFKINYHMMPGLPGVTKEMDMSSLKRIFDDSSFRPDMLKIYPCMVLKGTRLFDEWEKGKFSPLSTKKAAVLIAEFKRYVPEYVRIMRVQRDIPSNMITAGVDRTNLRQYIDRLNHGCRCIRCREAGHVYKTKGLRPGKVDIIVREYDASSGKEFFISVEDKEQDILLGFCRLRLPGQTLRPEITKASALVRELHVYGDLAEFGKKAKGHDIQHRGYGKRLLKKAEAIAKENSKKKVVVISGVGVRDYYRKQGYRREGPYMVKSI